ncbi:hypothetical protein [Niabella ginsengisoli]|uniref:DUF3592 domain-containing protein n=1 Tax=Niabella ginsengisoli TaxID=522298 RepID=A0ABS9SN17_9BACT|nr:hypothetical protein [Niabella ginsengisoli]MCH5599767.1 hypothetical protein [Niabella ginsengisoli]
MNVFKEKFEIAGKPFLFIAISYILGYSFLHWLLYLKYYLIPVKEIIFGYWIPFLLVWIPIYIWLKPKLKKLSFKKKDTVFRLMGLAAFMIAISTIVVQYYIETATGVLTELTSIKEYPNKPVTKYYSTKNYFIGREFKGVNYYTKVSGKRNRTYTMYAVIAVPIFEAVGDTMVQRSCSYWLVHKYQKNISNRKSFEEKQQIFEDFKKGSISNFDTLQLNNINYLERIGNVDLFDVYERAIYASSIEVPYRPVFFSMKTTSFSNRNGNKLLWSLVTFFMLCSIWMLALYLAKLKNENEK